MAKITDDLLTTSIDFNNGDGANTNQDPVWNAKEVQGQPWSSTPPSSGQLAEWNGSEWEPANPPSSPTITLTGVVEGSGTTNISTNFGPTPLYSLVGNPTASVADSVYIPVGSTLGFLANIMERAAITGDVAIPFGSNTSTISSNAVTYSKMQLVSASKLLGNSTGSPNVPMEISLDTTLNFTSNILGRAHIQGGDVDIPSSSNVALVTGIRGTQVSATAPTNGQVLAYNSGTTQYEPTTVSGGSGITALTGDVSATGPGSSAATVTGFRGIQTLAGTPFNGQGYVYLFGSSYRLVDINFLWDQSSTDVTVSSVNNTEETIYSNLISSGLMSITGHALTFKFQFTFTNTTLLKFYFGSLVTPIFTFNTTAPSSQASGQAVITIIYTSNTTAKASITVTAGKTLVAAETPFDFNDYATISGLNFSSPVSWKLTGTSTVASTTNTLTGHYYRINFGGG